MTKDYSKLALEIHEQNKGKITVQSKVKVENKDDLSIYRLNQQKNSNTVDKKKQ